MRDQFHRLTMPMLLTLLVSACANQAPRRPGDGRSNGSTLADQRDDFLIDCQRREQLNQPRSRECPTSSETRLSQPTLGPLVSPFPSLPGLPGGLTR